jgi:hypothetical protein
MAVKLLCVIGFYAAVASLLLVHRTWLLVA